MSAPSQFIFNYPSQSNCVRCLIIFLSVPAASACTGPSHARKSWVSSQQWTMAAGSLFSSSTARESHLKRLVLHVGSPAGTLTSPAGLPAFSCAVTRPITHELYILRTIALSLAITPRSIGCATGVQPAGTKMSRIHGYFCLTHGTMWYQPHHVSRMRTQICSPKGLHRPGLMARMVSIFALK